MEEVRLIISGKVQGVGFRQFVLQHADTLGLKGLVKNTLDGQVQVIAQGNKLLLEKLIALCTIGPASAEIENIDIAWTSLIKSYPNFSIMR